MKNILHLKAVLALTSAFIFVSQNVYAQTNIGAPTKEELRRNDVGSDISPPTQPFSIKNEIERSACPLASPEFAAVAFTLEQVDFTGSDLLDPAILNTTYVDYTGKSVPVSTICEIRDRVATELRNAGYLAAVQIPPQEIQNGRITLDILTARMTSSEIKGNIGRSKKLLQRYIDKLIQQPVFNANEAERYLLLANDIPGVNVKLTLKPDNSTEPNKTGNVVGVFNVSQTHLSADLNIQNFGSEEVGRFGGLARLGLTGVTGIGDETIASVYSTADFQEQQVYQLGHEFRLGGEGLIIGGNIGYAKTMPGISGGLNVESETILADLYGTYPFIRKQAKNLFGTVGVEYVDQDTKILGFETNEDTVSVAYARMDFSALHKKSIRGAEGYSGYEPKWAIAGEFELRKGLQILGASEGCGSDFQNCIGQTVLPTRVDGNPKAFVIRGRARLNYRPTPLVAMTLKPRFQYSSSGLFPYEEFSGGNYSIGRGYDPGVIIGDRGYGLQAELSYGSLAPKSSKDIAFQPYIFADALSVSNEDLPGIDDTISSIGGGLRAALGKRANLDIFAAAPLERGPFEVSKGDVRLLISLQAKIK